MSSDFLEKTGHGAEELRRHLPGKLREVPAARAGSVPGEPVLGDIRGALAVADGHAEGHRPAARARPGVRDPSAAAGGAPGEPRAGEGAGGPGEGAATVGGFWFRRLPRRGSIRRAGSGLHGLLASEFHPAVQVCGGRLMRADALYVSSCCPHSS